VAVIPEKISFHNSVIQYYTAGTGAQYIIALHGYGEDGNSYAFLENLLPTNYSLIAIDLPFHGGTIWQEGLHFSLEDLWQIIRGITKNTTIPYIIVGYSMGGRMALQLLQYYPQYFEKAVLLAPDGLHHNKCHFLSTQTRLGNRTFKWVMKHPKPLFVAMDISCKLKLFNKSVYNFAHYYLDDPHAREQLYVRWTTLRKFMPNHAILKQNIQKYKIPVHLIFGKYDRVITAKYGRLFKKGVENWVTIEELDSGHQLLKEKNAAYIAQAICK
jgi:pimeloyl-ACP methyl ester carboxylesterase